MTESGSEAHFVLFPTDIGTCAIAWRGTHIVSANLPEPSLEATRARIARRSGGQAATHVPEWVESAVADIRALIAGTPVDLSHIPCDFGTIDPMRIRIYELTRAIPPGATTTYGEIAEIIGNKRFAQAVGQAMGNNPIPIIVPCHRVMGANGKLTGFSASGGVSTKLRLLDIERAALGGGDGLFGHLPLAVKPAGNSR